MKLVICVNHSWPHVGGCEKVVQQIAEAMVKNHGYEVVVFSRSLNKSELFNNGVVYRRCGATARDFFEAMKKEKPDHVFVYSDCFQFWPQIIENSRAMPAKKSIALVGMNLMLQKRVIFSDYRARQADFTAITHSDDYLDYKTCVEAGIPVTVIPNGIDLTEFRPQEQSFREKYCITNKMILCVSNFFPAKGQEHMPKILDALYEKYPDFTAVFMCCNVNFYIANHLRDKFRSMLRASRFKSHLLVDCPRSEVIQAFHDADVFAFPSQIEVAPLVLLESMAAGLPWVSLPVGNAKSLAGGKLVPVAGKNMKGEWLYAPETYQGFTQNLYDILTDSALHAKLSQAGKSLIGSKYNWDSIAEQYHQVFSK